MKPLFGSLVAAAVAGLAGGALACPQEPACTVTHVHHHYHHGAAQAKAKAKPAKAHVKRTQRPKAYAKAHASSGYSRGPARGDEGMGYGRSHGEGYGYVGGRAHVDQSAYARSYSAYDVQAYAYDSGWVYGPPQFPGSPPQPPAPPPYGQAHGSSYSSYSSYGDVSIAPAPYGHVVQQGYVGGYAHPPLPPHPVMQTCPHPGAVVCFPAVSSGPVHYIPAPSHGHAPVALQSETVGTLSGGVSGFESFGGFGGGGRGVVIVNQSSSASAYANARAAAYASASARGKYGKGGHGKH